MLTPSFLYVYTYMEGIMPTATEQQMLEAFRALPAHLRRAIYYIALEFEKTHRKENT